MNRTRIEWATTSWNPVTGCSPVSAACDHCYAARMAKRLRGRYGYPADEPFRVTLHYDRLEEPLRWKKPQRVFVVSMGDLFHDDVPSEFIDDVFTVMARCQQHTFLLLTKRVGRMRGYIVNWLWRQDGTELPPGTVRPLSHVWLGVTAENQAAADERIPLLLQTPAAKRFVSVEPMLGAMDLNSIKGGTLWIGGQRGCAGMHHGIGTHDCPREWHHHHDERCGPGLDWVICGGETGPGARPMHPEWVRSLRDQCQAAGVPFLFKAWGDATEVGCGLPGHPLYEAWWRGGKKGGRLLDGREWNESPEVA